MTTAFQANAFQTSPLAWQIDVTPVVVDTHANLQGGGGAIGRESEFVKRAEFFLARRKKQRENLVKIIETIMPLITTGSKTKTRIYL